MNSVEPKEEIGELSTLRFTLAKLGPTGKFNFLQDLLGILRNHKDILVFLHLSGKLVILPLSEGQNGHFNIPSLLKWGTGQPREPKGSSSPNC